MQMLPLLAMGAMMAASPKPKAPPPPPTPQPEPVAPTRNDAAVRAQEANTIRKRSADQGRASTNLTGNVGGGTAYGNTVLGQ